jgi:hypothetical protein
MGSANDIKLTLGLGVAVMVAVGAFTLTRSPPRVVRTSSRGGSLFIHTVGDRELCQANEVLPAAVSAIRLSLVAFYGSRVRVMVSSGSRLLTEGRRGPEWTGGSVTVPVAPLNLLASHVKLCVELGPNSEPIDFTGVKTSARDSAVWRGGQPLGGRVGVEYLAAGRGSWWSRILPVARHMGIGHALSGTWVALLTAVLVAALGLLAMRLILRELP